MLGKRLQVSRRRPKRLVFESCSVLEHRSVDTNLYAVRNHQSAAAHPLIVQVSVPPHASAIRSTSVGLESTESLVNGLVFIETSVLAEALTHQEKGKWS